MLNLPDKDPSKKMQVLHSLHVLSLDKKHAVLVQWLKSEWERMAHESVDMEGTILHRTQGAQKVLAEIIEYVRTSSEKIDTWTEIYRNEPRVR